MRIDLLRYSDSRLTLYSIEIGMIVVSSEAAQLECVKSSRQDPLIASKDSIDVLEHVTLECAIA